MDGFAGLLAPGIAIFLASLVLTCASLWIGARLAPWFLKEPAEPPPTVRSYFLDPAAEMNMTRCGSRRCSSHRRSCSLRC